MSRYYLAQVVTQEEYDALSLGSKFGTGIVVEGMSYEQDLILITAHKHEDNLEDEYYKTDERGVRIT